MPHRAQEPRCLWMESSPVTQAHAHARAAVTQIQSHKPSSAAEEHAHAAGEFARAAKGTTDAEVGIPGEMRRQRC